jgi:serine/threonine protein kinase
MKSIVGTLSIMQSKDLLHRDIKPENILIRYGKSDSK